MLAEFVCPALFPWSVPVYERLHQLMEEKPNMFRPYARIHAVFGCFNNFKWNGGGERIFGAMPTEEVINRTFDFYKSVGIEVYLTATNPCIEERDLYDRYGNMMLRLAQRRNDWVKVLVSSPLLDEYIRQSYPEIRLMKSIIASEHITDYDAELERYDQMVIGRRFAFNLDKMKTIKEENRNRYEILLNDECQLTCPRLYTHYWSNGPVFLFEKELAEAPEFFCSSPLSGTAFTMYTDRFTIIDSKMLEEMYMPMGFSKFKISGRGNNNRIMRETIPFLAKPEFQTEVYRDVATYVLENRLTYSVKDYA